MDEDQRVGRGAEQQRERDRRVGGVVDGALALDEEQIGVGVVEHELLGGAGREVGDDAIDRDPAAGDEDPGLARRDEARALAALARRAHVSSSEAVILPTAQSLPTVSTTRAATP